MVAQKEEVSQASQPGSSKYTQPSTSFEDLLSAAVKQTSRQVSEKNTNLPWIRKLDINKGSSNNKRKNKSTNVSKPATFSRKQKQNLWSKWI